MAEYDIILTMTAFVELSFIIFIATIVSCIMRLFRQPLIVGYIITGIIIGPFILDVVQFSGYFELFSKIGISILLFIVGLSLNPHVVKEVGKTSLLAGAGQVIVTTIIGFLLVYGLGYDSTSALYAAFALTFSSTIIILKILTDKGDISKLYGKISIGLLLVQDIVATVVLLVVSTLNASTSAGITSLILTLTVRGIALTAIFYIVSKYILPEFGKFLASSQELLFLFSIAWGLVLASLFYIMGFSVEIGALVAGVTLSVSPFAYEIGSRMRPLRDFFVVLFFIYLGTQIVVTNIGNLIYPALILSIFVLIVKPIIVFILMNLLGYRRKTSFLTGLTVGQVSEFSLILISLGLSMGHITRELVSLVTLTGIISIAGSTYFMFHADSIYLRLEWLFKFLEFRKPFIKEKGRDGTKYDIIIFGYDRVGVDFVVAAEKLEKKYLVVDFNPASIIKLQEKNIPSRYGDAEDVEFLAELDLASASLVISTIPEFGTNITLLKMYRRVNATGIVILLSHDIDETEKLYEAGASYVVMPHFLGARHAAHMISKHGLNAEEFEHERQAHLVKLAKREV
jgi:Kef-type K+ transport system membrane component KefB/voltage-gated potassium channel Kch